MPEQTGKNAGMDDRERSEKGLLAVSFGTTHRTTCEETIGAIENALAEVYPERKLYRGWTSRMIIRRLRERDGIHCDTVEEALDRMKADGVKDVLVVPTHMIGGQENDKMKEILRAKAEDFEEMKLSRPLLAEEADLEELARILAEELIAESGGAEKGAGPALLLMGHGSADKPEVNRVYSRLEEIFHRQGCRRIFVAAVEGSPSLEEAMEKLEASFGPAGDGRTEESGSGPAGDGKPEESDGEELRGDRGVLLAPLMIVAGDHAVRDMAGDDEDSWKSRLAAGGWEPRPLLRGLGSYAGVQQMFIRHAGEARPMDGNEETAEGAGRETR